MNVIKNTRFDEERALYGLEDARILNCVFDGPADGESACKECSKIQADHCWFNLRYPLWHNNNLQVTYSSMSANAKAALWYCKDVAVMGSRLHGKKAMRQCTNAAIRICDIVSPEFGWNCSNVQMVESHVTSDYCMQRSSNLQFANVTLDGDYAFQYIQNGAFDHCILNTKDAFWHARNVKLTNSVIKGEYLGWYSDYLTFENCTIIGSQPLCYCKHLTLNNCLLLEADLCFERSDVQATLVAPVISIKNPASGRIHVPAIKEIIRDVQGMNGEIVVNNAVY